MSARRPLLTAAAAGSMLCALWFVPSANATADRDGGAPAAQTSQTTQGSPTRVGDQAPAGTGESDGLDLADSGSIDVTPYLVGGTAFLGLGVAMVTASVRRTRPTAY